MKVKVFSALTANGLENRINDFIYNNERIEVKEIKFSTTMLRCKALILYVDRKDKYLDHYIK